MRITRAYTITPEVKRILDTKPNKSEYICRAVRKMHTLEIDFDIRDVPTRQLYAALLTRGDVPHHIRVQLEHTLQTTFTS